MTTISSLLLPLSGMVYLNKLKKKASIYPYLATPFSSTSIQNYQKTNTAKDQSLFGMPWKTVKDKDKPSLTQTYVPGASGPTGVPLSQKSSTQSSIAASECMQRGVTIDELFDISLDKSLDLIRDDLNNHVKAKLEKRQKLNMADVALLDWVMCDQSGQYKNQYRCKIRTKAIKYIGWAVEQGNPIEFTENHFKILHGEIIEGNGAEHPKLYASEKGVETAINVAIKTFSNCFFNSMYYQESLGPYYKKSLERIAEKHPDKMIAIFQSIYTSTQDKNTTTKYTALNALRDIMKLFQELNLPSEVRSVLINVPPHVITAMYNEIIHPTSISLRNASIGALTQLVFGISIPPFSAETQSKLIPVLLNTLKEPTNPNHPRLADTVSKLIHQASERGIITDKNEGLNVFYTYIRNNMNIEPIILSTIIHTVGNVYGGEKSSRPMPDDIFFVIISEAANQKDEDLKKVACLTRSTYMERIRQVRSTIRILSEKPSSGAIRYFTNQIGKDGVITKTFGTDIQEKLLPKLFSILKQPTDDSSIIKEEIEATKAFFEKASNESMFTHKGLDIIAATISKKNVHQEVLEMGVFLLGNAYRTGTSTNRDFPKKLKDLLDYWALKQDKDATLKQAAKRERDEILKALSR